MMLNEYRTQKSPTKNEWNKTLVVGVFCFAVFVALRGYSHWTKSPASISTNFVQGDDLILAAFGKWTAKYNKIYLTREESSFRFRIFQQNMKKVKEMIDHGINYTVGLTKFSDLSAEEFRALYVSALPTRNNSSRHVVHLDTDNLPDQIDWRVKGAVSEVRNQGFCASGWAFAAVGALEGLNFLKNGKLKTFSEQQLIDCSGKYGNNGCKGGFEYYGYSYVADNGIESLKDYPYKAVDMYCRYDASKVVFQNKGLAHIAVNDPDQIAAALVNQPVTVAVEADRDPFQFYISGVLDSVDCGTNLNHALVAVGYNNKNSQPYWILKNSWGPDFGESGYIRILKTSTKEPGICGVAADPSYPTA